MATPLNPDMIIGIDCGKSGAIVYWNKDITKAVKMPESSQEIYEYLKYLHSICERPLVVIERQQLMGKDFSNPGKPYRAMKLVSNFTEIISFLLTLGMPCVQVMPVTWMKKLQIHIKDEEYSSRKKRFVGIAAKKAPTIKVTQWNADAILIVAFARVMMQSDQKWLRDKMTPKDIAILTGELQSFEIQF